MRPGCGFPGAGDESEIAVRMRRLGAIDGAPRTYRDRARRVEIQIETGSARGTEPEKLRAGRSPLVRIKIAGIEEFELFVAGWIDAAIYHWSAPLNTTLLDFPGARM